MSCKFFLFEIYSSNKLHEIVKSLFPLKDVDKTKSAISFQLLVVLMGGNVFIFRLHVKLKHEEPVSWITDHGFENLRMPGP
jgi:hypothetical protein